MRPSSDRTPFYPPNPRPNLPPSSQLRERSASTGHRGGGPPPAGFYPPQPQSTPPSQYGGQRLSLGGQRPSLSYYDFPFAQSAPPSRTYLQNGPPPILSRRLTFGGSESFQTPASGSGGHARGVYAHAAPRHHCESEDSPSYRAEDQQFAVSAESIPDGARELIVFVFRSTLPRRPPISTWKMWTRRCVCLVVFSEGVADNRCGEQSKKRPKTPPDLCAVCGAVSRSSTAGCGRTDSLMQTETPEWRKGAFLAELRSLGLSSLTEVNDHRSRWRPLPLQRLWTLGCKGTRTLHDFCKSDSLTERFAASEGANSARSVIVVRTPVCAV